MTDTPDDDPAELLMDILATASNRFKAATYGKERFRPFVDAIKRADGCACDACVSTAIQAMLVQCFTNADGTENVLQIIAEWREFLDQMEASARRQAEQEAAIGPAANERPV